MPYQVGAHCYATKLDAGPPACAAFTPVSVVQGDSLVTVGCSSVNADASLLMYRSVANMTSGTISTTSFSQTLNYGDCQENDYLIAASALAGPILALLVSCWTLWKIISYLGWGRADST